MPSDSAMWYVDPGPDSPVAPYWEAHDPRGSGVIGAPTPTELKQAILDTLAGLNSTGV